MVCHLLPFAKVGQYCFPQYYFVDRSLVFSKILTSTTYYFHSIVYISVVFPNNEYL